MTISQSCSQISIDRLAGILGRIRVSARVFRAAALLEAASFDDALGGHLHAVRAGRVSIVTADGAKTEIAAPSVILLPRARAHTITPLSPDADLASAVVDLGGDINPVALAMPDMQVVALDGDDQGQHLGGVLKLLFAEAAVRHCGRQTVMDRLAEAALVLILRQAMENPAGIGLLAGLAHPQLTLALTAIHDRPGGDWNLENLADTAGLSRSSFAETFHHVVGQPPGQYLTGWRMALARTALEKGMAVKKVAQEVGYASPAALSRAFSRHFGTSARDLLKAAR